MKKNMILTTFAGLIILLILTGCQQGGTGGTGYYRYTGSQAIEASFVPEEPVSSEISAYSKGEKIPVTIELTNRLTTEVPAGKVKLRLTGDAAAPNFFQGAKIVTNTKLDPIDAETGGTEPEQIELGPLTYVGDLAAKTSKTISAEYCYEVPAKIKANLYYTDKDAEIGVNLPGGANPPSRVQVTEIKQGTVKVDSGKGVLKFKITLKNLGSGTIIDSLNECFKYRDQTHREKISLKAEGAYPIICEDNGEITLSKVDKTKVVSCDATNIDPASIGKEASELTITLSKFAYEEQIQPVTV
ncbi:hypothetical protein HY643_03180, partial [Candidatus Woesearchaeota archaeon]|nr:hypothetical protein [Candidatus Woesearchaeota archaeon]